MNHALTILRAFVLVSKNKSMGGKMLQALSHITWELPQQLAGVVIAGIVNAIGGIKSISTHDGAIILQCSLLARGAGYTLGNVITVGVGTSARVVQHEYGHYLQSRILGPLYNLVIVPFSLGWAAGYGKLWGFKRSYFSFFTERWADQLANVVRTDAHE